MKSIIGTFRTKKSSEHGSYQYLSLHPFPNDEFHDALTKKHFSKANTAQFLLGELSGVTRFLPDVDFFLTSFIMKDAESSAQIEGTRASIADALEYSIDPQANKQTDADDILHYVEALKYGIKRLKEDDFPFSLRFIRELHDVLMQDARATQFADPGNFRTSQNWIGGTMPGNANFVPPSHEEIADNLKDLEAFIHDPFSHPIIDAGLLHAQFETIHPFLDGNGRTGRLLVTFYFMHHKCVSQPVLFLSSYFLKHKKAYYQHLDNYHNGNIAPWVDFFLDAVIQTAKEGIELSEKIMQQRDKDLERISTLDIRASENAIPTLRELYRAPIVSSTKVMEWIDKSRPATLDFIDRLTSIGILEKYQEGEGNRPSLYRHREYLDIFTQHHT